jgi:VanZ family protein
MPKLARPVFYAAVVATLFLALGPSSLSPVVINDKVEHFVGFLLLMTLGIYAFGTHRMLRLALALAGFGAAIELLQMLPIVGRDGEVLDFVADSLGVLTAMAIVSALRWQAARA